MRPMRATHDQGAPSLGSHVAFERCGKVREVDPFLAAALRVAYSKAGSDNRTLDPIARIILPQPSNGLSGLLVLPLTQNPRQDAQTLPPFRFNPVAFEFPCPLHRPPGAPRPLSSLILLPPSISAPSSWRRHPTSRGFSPSGPLRISLTACPPGPLQSEHRTLEMGLRTWVAEQTQLTLGYVEQLYTFGDRDRAEAA